FSLQHLPGREALEKSLEQRRFLMRILAVPQIAKFAQRKAEAERNGIARPRLDDDVAGADGVVVERRRDRDVVLPRVRERVLREREAELERRPAVAIELLDELAVAPRIADDEH